MSRLNQLIQELCPDGVEYKKLGDICTFKRGTSITKKDIVEGDIPVIAGGQEPAYYHNQANRTGETVVISSSGHAGFVSYWEQPIFVSDAFSVEPNGKILTKYLYYFLKSKQDEIYSLQKAGGVPHVYSTDIAPLKIPLPPLPVQQEIVQILDTFTELIKELNAELEARRKQYEYYRDLLLTFGDEVEWIAELCPDGVEFVTVQEICDITRGRVMSKNYLRENTGVYPVYSSQTANNGVLGYINTFDYDCESVTWTTDGANAGSVFYHVNEKFSITNVCGLLRVKNNELVSTKFLFYVLQVYAKKYVNDGMGNPKLMSNVMARISVPLPPLPVQQEIVRILDNFTELIAELTAELTARQKQYEYYRDKLLSFKEVSS